MFQGQCAFSGYMVPRGSGINKVGSDGKITLTRTNKEKYLIEQKISPRDCKWTLSSRAFFKKTNKATKDHNEFVQITKIVRGFTLIPKAIISETVKPHKSEENKRNEKVNLKSNMTKNSSKK